MMDVIPILMFSLFFIFEINRVWLKLNLHINLFFLITFFCLFFFISPNLDYEFLNGSEFYIANYLFLLMYSFIFYLKKSDAFSLMLTSFLIFNLSIYFRSIDNNICHSLSIGTHFLWHFFNAILLKNLTYLNCKIIQKKI